MDALKAARQEYKDCEARHSHPSSAGGGLSVADAVYFYSICRTDYETAIKAALEKDKK
jgi:hypothetical protein